MATHVKERREKVVLLFVEALGVRNHIVDEDQRPILQERAPRAF